MKSEIQWICVNSIVFNKFLKLKKSFWSKLFLRRSGGSDFFANTSNFRCMFHCKVKKLTIVVCHKTFTPLLEYLLLQTFAA